MNESRIDIIKEKWDIQLNEFLISCKVFSEHFLDSNADIQVDWFWCNIIMSVNKPTTEKKILSKRVGKQKENQFIWSVVKESDVT